MKDYLKLIGLQVISSLLDICIVLCIISILIGPK